MFCDPSALWHKGDVKNASKRVRRFMPGDTALCAVNQEQLVALGHHLNALPRKYLCYRTPAEVFMTHLRHCA